MAGILFSYNATGLPLEAARGPPGARGPQVETPGLHNVTPLYRTTLRRQQREPDNVREVNSRTGIHLRSDITPRLQLIRNKPAKPTCRLTNYELLR